MKTKVSRRELWMRPVALTVAGAMLAPTLAGCSGGAETVSPPPPMGSRPMAGQRPMGRPPMMAGQKQGLTGKQKMLLLAGAAALYYIYKKRQNAQAQAGPEGKYFISKSNGRVYYRDLKTGAFQYVSPPTQPIQVPMEEAREYSGYQGYNNGRSGKQFGGYGYNSSGSYTDAVPAPAF